MVAPGQPLKKPEEETIGIWEMAGIPIGAIISIEVHTNPPLSVLVQYDPYSGTVTIRGTNQDARPLEPLVGIALLLGGVWSLSRSGHLVLT